MQTTRLGLFLCLFMTTMPALSPAAAPPLAPQRPHEMTHHGVTRVDPFYWLRERENPEVLEYLKAENAYTAEIMAPTQSLQEKLLAELIGRTAENDQMAPYREGAFFYYHRIKEGQSYRTYLRRRAAGNGALGIEEVYFDANKEAEGQAFFDLGYLEVSPNGRLLAYTIDLEGDEQYRLHFRDLETGEAIGETLYPVSPSSGEWADNETFFYGIDDPVNQRPNAIKRHTLGTDPAQDEEVYRDDDERFFVHLSKTQDGTHLIASSGSRKTNEHWVLPVEDQDGAFRVLMPRVQDLEYMVERHEDKWVIWTNRDGAKEFKLMTVPLDNPTWEGAEDLIPARKAVRIDDYLVLENFLVVEEREQGNVRLRVRRWADGAEHFIAVDDEAYTLSMATNAAYETDILRYSYESPITPSQVWAYDLAARERVLVKEAEVPSGHDSSQYIVHREMAVAPDGVEVPVTIWHHKDTPIDGSAPLYLYAYGSYGATMDPGFWRSTYVYVERGFVCAVAHVRGGGFLGEQWYLDGKFRQKKNTFTDYIAVAEHLIEAGYTRPGQIAAEGGSAGGLLMGAIANMRPDLWGAIGAHVPFVDVVTTMLDPTIPLTTVEYEEWGNPEDEAYFHYMLAYSPYDQVSAQAYPPMLVTAGLHDPRVQYWEAAKWVAKLRATAPSPAPLLLKTNMEAGHGGASGRYDALRERAFEQAFLLWSLGIKE